MNMQDKIKITVLSENTAGGLGLLGEHGLAFWIEIGDTKILFDTGQGLALDSNAKYLGIHLDQADAIALSHGHYDHTGGLELAISHMKRKIPLYAHRGAFEPKYIRKPDGTPRDIGIPPKCKQAALDKADIIHVEGVTEVSEGLYLTGTIARTNDFEGSGKPNPNNPLPHNLDDDQAAFIETPAGVVVILGCAHSGVINTLRYIQSLTDNQQIHAVIGGMHLPKVSSERLAKTVAELRKMNITHLMPCHCTGLNAIVRLRTEFPKTTCPCNAGTIIEFPSLA